jgi:hypothetical protein
MATISERLAQAQAAYDDLLIGKAVAEFRDQNGEIVRYNQANRAALAAHIEKLKVDLANEAGTPLPGGPMRIFM